MRPSGAQRARHPANARDESDTVRGKHEFIGDGRVRSSNNKLKGLRIAPSESNAWAICVEVMTSISARGVAFSTAFHVKGCYFSHFGTAFLLKGLHF